MKKKVVESCVLVVDNSPFGKNTDFQPSRFQSGIAAAQLLSFVFFDADDDVVKQMTILTSVPPFLPSEAFSSFEQVRSGLGELAISFEEPDFDSALGVSRLLLMRGGGGGEKGAKRRCICLIGSPLQRSLSERFSDLNGIDLDIVLYGDDCLAHNRQMCAAASKSVRIWEIPKT